MATGSLPSETGFQRFWFASEALPGIEKGNVWSVEDILARVAQPGKRVLLLDDGGNWRGCGTAWHLAERDHAVTLLTPDGLVGRELVRSAADFPLRRKLKRLGVSFITDSAVKAWHGNAATIVNLLDDSEQKLDFDALVLATPNVSETTLLDELADDGIELYAVGDCVAPRWAVHAIYEGRKLGREL